MKRFSSYILVVISVLLFASCQKEMSGYLTADIEGYNGGNEKVYISDRYSCWHDGDEVMVNTTSCRISVESENNQAIISGITPQEGSAYRAVYPASADNGANSVKLPEIQYYRTQNPPAGTGLESRSEYQVVDAPMVAYTDGSAERENHLTFYNLCSLLKITIPNFETNNPAPVAEGVYNPEVSHPITVSRIEVTSTTAAPLWGVLSYTQSPEAEPEVGVLSNGAADEATVVLAVPDDKINIGESKSYYIAIPPVQSNFRVKVYYKVESGSGYKSGSIETETSATTVPNIGRNNIVSMDLSSDQIRGYWEVKDESQDRLIGDGSEPNPFRVYSEEDLLAAKQRANDPNNFWWYKQMNDINISRLNPDQDVYGFTGVYDGDNYKITIHETSGSLFSTVNSVRSERPSVIKNLSVEANIPATAVNRGGIVGKVSNWNFATIENCHFSGSVSASQYAGGILGLCGGTVTISNCSNKGIIRAQNVGGIVGAANSLNMVNCANHGEVQYQDAHASITRNCGGLVGAGKGYITNSYSDGKVIGAEGANTGGLVGEGKPTLNNVYVGCAEQPVNGNWIGGKGFNGSNIYSPVAEGEGTQSSIKYNPITWQLDDGTTLVDALNGKGGVWKGSLSGNTGRPMLSFE